MRTKATTHKQFFALLKQVGISAADRGLLIASFTNGATESLSDMYNNYQTAYEQMIKHLQNRNKNEWLPLRLMQLGK